MSMKELIAARAGRATVIGGAFRRSKDELGAQANLHFRLVEVAMMLMLPCLRSRWRCRPSEAPRRSGSSSGS